MVVCTQGFAVYTKRKWNGVGGLGFKGVFSFVQ